jgi:outer membrane protein assembly factor BamB
MNFPKPPQSPQISKNKPMKKYILPALLLSISLGACGSGNWFGDKKDKAPLKGDRISVLDYEKDLRPEEETSGAAFSAGEIWKNEAWPQTGGNPDHAMHNLALSDKALKKVWSSSIGTGSQKNLPLTAQPIVLGESIFTLDTEGMLSSFSTEDGKKRWNVDVADPEEEDDDSVISGGIAADAGVIYVTAGYDEIVAVDAQKGDIKWRAKMNGPSRAAPTVVGGRVFVITLSNSILALDATNGAVQWEFSGLGQSTGLVGAASPAATNDLVVPAFSSGEIYAIRAGNGSVAWSDNLASTVKLGGISGLSDIRGLPVIDNNVVYAISFGGKAAAIDLMTGARIWQRDISGAETPWISGNRLYLISSEGQIVALDKEKGTVIWVSQLARFKDKVDRTGPIFWSGPLMAGGRLLAFSTDGRVAEISPEKGTLIREWNSGEDVRISPVIAGGTLYILSDDGDLVAYR